MEKLTLKDEKDLAVEQHEVSHLAIINVHCLICYFHLQAEKISLKRQKDKAVSEVERLEVIPLDATSDIV